MRSVGVSCCICYFPQLGGHWAEEGMTTVNQTGRVVGGVCAKHPTVRGGSRRFPTVGEISRTDQRWRGKPTKEERNDGFPMHLQVLVSIIAQSKLTTL